MAPNQHPHVAGFGLAGGPDGPVVCVRVEAANGAAVWIGRASPGTETHIVENPDSVRYVPLDEVRWVLETWPATQGNAGEAIQAAAWRGRQVLLRTQESPGNAPPGQSIASPG